MKRALIEILSIGLGYDSPSTPMTGLPAADQDCLLSNELFEKLVEERGMVLMSTEEKEGRLIHDVIPIQGKEGDYSNEGSTFFPFHVEVPHYSLEDRPDYIMFLCVRGCKAARTLVIELDKLLPVLRSNMLPVDFKMLFTESFSLRTGVSFGGKETHTTAILHNVGDEVMITLDLAEMSGISSAAQKVLDKVKSLIDAFYLSIVTEIPTKRGDVLVFDNKRCIHARNNYSEAVVYDGTQRWIKRGYLKLK